MGVNPLRAFLGKPKGLQHRVIPPLQGRPPASLSPRHTGSCQRSHLDTSVSPRFRAGKTHGQGLSVGFLVGLAHWELRAGLWRATPLPLTPAPGTAEPGPTPARVLPARLRDSGGPCLGVIWRHRPFSGPRSPCHRSPLSPSPPPWEQGLTGQGRTACLPRPGVAHGCPLRARPPGEGAPLGI